LNTKSPLVHEKTLQQLRFHLQHESARQVVGRKRAHRHQDLSLMLVRLFHPAQGILQRLLRDETLFQQDLTQALGQHVGAYRDRVALVEADNLLGVAAREQQGSRHASGIRPLHEPRKWLTGQRSVHLRLALGEMLGRGFHGTLLAFLCRSAAAAPG